MEKGNAWIVHGHRSGRPLLILCAANGAAVMIDLAVPLVKERAMAKMNGVAVVLNENEIIEAEVDRLVAEEVAKRRAALRLEVADRMRREAFQKRMDEIKRRGDEVDAAQLAFDTDPQRLVELEASRKAMLEKRAAAEARFAAGEKARVEAEKRLPRMGGGAEGFERR
jgi:hypothetical protein